MCVPFSCTVPGSAQCSAVAVLKFLIIFKRRGPANCVAIPAAASFFLLSPSFSFLKKVSSLDFYFSLPSLLTDPWPPWVGSCGSGQHPLPTFGSFFLSKPLSALPSGRPFRHTKHGPPQDLLLLSERPCMFPIFSWLGPFPHAGLGSKSLPLPQNPSLLTPLTSVSTITQNPFYALRHTTYGALSSS